MRPWPGVTAGRELEALAAHLEAARELLGRPEVEEQLMTETEARHEAAGHVDYLALRLRLMAEKLGRGRRG